MRQTYEWKQKHCKGADESKSKKKAKARFADLHFAQICQQTKLHLSQLRRASNANVETESITWYQVAACHVFLYLSVDIQYIIDIINAELGNQQGR